VEAVTLVLVFVSVSLTPLLALERNGRMQLTQNSPHLHDRF